MAKYQPSLFGDSITENSVSGNLTKLKSSRASEELTKTADPQ
jgi:hypothetical protein